LLVVIANNYTRIPRFTRLL